MTVHHRANAIAGLLLLAMFGAACSSSHGFESDVEAALGTTSGSPLLVLFGLDGATDTARDLGGEAAIADCMAREGFDYVVEPLPFPTGADAGPFDGPPTLALVETAGYGIADQTELQLDTAGTPFAGNPQAEILEGLSEAELADYRRALTGIRDDEAVFDEAGRPVDPRSGEPLDVQRLRDAMGDGCAALGTASLRVGNAELLGSDLYFEAQNLVLSQPRMVELQDDWQRCMADQGHDYFAQSAIIGELYDRAETILNQVDLPAHGAPDAPGDPLDAGQVEAARTQLDLLRQVEITIALADYQCSEALFDEAPDIAREVEKQFIDDNEARLVELLEAALDAP